MKRGEEEELTQDDMYEVTEKISIKKRAAWLPVMRVAPVTGLHSVAKKILLVLPIFFWKDLDI
jgi:hypothetical protein